MKRLYEFTITREETVKESHTEKNDQGQEVTTTTDVKKLVDNNYFLRKPTRKLFDAAELYYAVQLSEGIKAGLLTRPLLAKRFNNDGGILSEDEKTEFKELYDNIFEKQVEAQVIALKPKDSRTEEEQQRYEETKEYLLEAKKQLQEFELARSTLYDQTAENRARNKTIFWWVLHLSHMIDEEGKEHPVFAGEEFSEKTKVYDELEDRDDDYDNELVQKLFYYTSFWYVSKTNDTEELKRLLEMAENEDLTGLEETEKATEEFAANKLDEEKKKTEDEEKAEEPQSEEPKEEEPQSEEPKEEEPKEESKSDDS